MHIALNSAGFQYFDAFCFDIPKDLSCNLDLRDFNIGVDESILANHQRAFRANRPMKIAIETQSARKMQFPGYAGSLIQES